MPAPLTWDSPLLTWDSPLPGAAWDGSAPEPAPPPKPKKKPFRRKAKPKNTEPPNPNTTTMSTFKFIVSPKSTGGFRTSAVLGAQINETALAASIAASVGVTPEQVTLVAKALFAKLRECANGCDWAPALFGELSVRPTSGGSSPSPDGFQNAEEINADIALSFNAEIIDAWRSTLVLEARGRRAWSRP